MKSNILKSILAILLSAIMFVACEDEPGSLGLENIPDSDKLGVEEINSLEVPMMQKSSFYNAAPGDSTWDLGTSIRLFVGRTSYVNSSMLIRFRTVVPDSIIEYYDNGALQIQKAWIELRPASVMDVEGTQLDLEVSKINTSWNSSLFTKDTLDQNVLPYISDTWQVSDLNDTLVTFNISNDMANDWLVSSIKDSSELNYGLLFQPSAGSNKLLSFYSLHTDNVVDGYDNIPVTKIEINKEDSGLDTLLFYSSRDVHVIDGNIPADDGTYLYLQGGYPIRGNYFIDVSAVPENSVIVDAVMDFYYDPNLTKMSSSKSNSIYAFMYADSVEKQILSTVKTLSRDTTEYKFSGNVTQIIQSWNQGTENQGLFINMVDEQYTLNRLAFYGPNYSDAALRPKLTIKYTRK